MHTYASDSPDRTIAPWVIAAIAVVVAYAYFIATSRYEFSMPWWMEAPSILGVYGAGYWMYDRWLWKKTLFGFQECLPSPPAPLPRTGEGSLIRGASVAVLRLPRPTFGRRRSQPQR